VTVHLMGGGKKYGRDKNALKGHSKKQVFKKKKSSPEVKNKKILVGGLYSGKKTIKGTLAAAGQLFEKKWGYSVTHGR